MHVKRSYSKDSTDKGWAGRWTSAWDGFFMHCQYTIEERCGVLTCFNDGILNVIEIFGKRCDQLELYGNYGYALPGFMQFTDHLANRYYKTN
jgi:hypothetical protein